MNKKKIDAVANSEEIAQALKMGGFIMQFLVKAYDGPDMLEKRMAVHPRHLEGMKKLGKQIICAGGLLDDEGNQYRYPYEPTPYSVLERLANSSYIRKDNTLIDYRLYPRTGTL